jgi:hypothetical protein
MHVLVRRPRWELVSLTVALLVVAAVWAVTAPPAATAAPPSNTWGLTTLQAHLDSGSVQGYFLTVLGGATEADQTPIAIPATIESIVPAATQDGALILFAATGPTITDIGGIAAGMSGSPLYVGDPASPQPATDPLVGAVSYGDIFTTGGLGLATPIEYMIAIQTSHAAAMPAAAPAAHAESLRLARPVTTASTRVRRIVVSANAAQAESVQAAAGTAVFAPLDVIQIGGLSPRSRLFKETASKLEAAGHQVVAAPGTSAAGAYDPAWSAPFVAGGSIGTVYSVGDLWMGSAGTVTYVDGSTVMAYGHPLDWLGSSTAYLTNAWVSGIWHTTYSPYKLMAVAATRGAITQDRGSGVEGVVGTLPAETTVTASATYGGTTVQSASRVPQAVVDPMLFYDLPVYAAQVPIYKAIDAGQLGGSATTTSTVVVNDGTSDYTVTINNVWDNPYDVTWDVTSDIDNMLYTLTQNADGIAPATIKSVDFSTDLSAQRNRVRIVGARVPGGLRIGANDVTVKLAEYGVKDLLTAHVTLTLPAGTALGSGIEIYGPDSYGDDYWFEDFLGAPRASDDRQSVADLVAQLEQAPTNNEIVVAYENDAPFTASPEGTGATTWFVSGDLYMSPSRMLLQAPAKVVKRHSPAVLMGTVMRTNTATKVSLYESRVGTSKRRLIATVPVQRSAQGVGTFSYVRKNLKASTRFTAVWDGDDSTLGATAKVVVRVK